MKALVLLPLIMATLATSAVAQGKSNPVPKASISRERLTKAFGHVRAAHEISKGGTPKAASAFASEAEGKSDADLRREIGHAAGSVEAAFSKIPTKLQQLDVRAHLHVAFLTLTSTRKTTFEEARENLRERGKKKQTDNHAADLHRKVEAIQAALKTS